MTEALTFDPAWLFSSLCGLLLYVWRKQEGRIADLERRLEALKEQQCKTVEEIHKNYVPRADCRERTGQILSGLERVDNKLDRVADLARGGNNGNHA